MGTENYNYFVFISNKFESAVCTTVLFSTTQGKEKQ